MQLLTRFQELEAFEKIVQSKQLTKFVQHVWVAQEILTLGRTVFQKRRLNLFEHASKFFFRFPVHDRCRLSVDSVGNMGYVLVILVQFQTFQNLLHFSGRDVRHVFDPLLFNFDIDRHGHRGQITGQISASILIFSTELGDKKNSTSDLCGSKFKRLGSLLVHTPRLSHSAGAEG